MEIVFRLAQCRDILTLGQHIQNVVEVSDLQVAQPARICRMVDEAVSTGNAFVCEVDGKVVGSLCAKWREDWFGARTVEIGNLWMNKGQSPRTVYRLLLFAYEHLSTRGAEQFMLTEAAGSPHKPFAALGFKTVATIKVGSVDEVGQALLKRGK